MEITGYKDKHEWTNKNGVTSVVYLMDCMELLKQVPDKYFELAVVDPPYGIGASRATGTYARKATKYTAKTDKKWDTAIPCALYFEELYKCSINQVIWGGNYMVNFLPASQGWICWYKTDELKGRDSSEFELAFTSFQRAARHIELRPFIKSFDRIHPTQKPQQLYEWIFKNYAKPNDKILDTHLGSGSSRIAADKANLPFVGCELDEDYFYASVKRFKEYSAQTTMF